MTLKLPTGRKLSESPEILAEFEQVRAGIDALRLGGQMMASGDSDTAIEPGDTPPAP